MNTITYLLKLFVVNLYINFILNSNDLIGCGGFVKSIVNIDYSRVSIKLYTSNENLKYTSDCAPNNGYYFIPVYNKGEYILMIDGPLGWKFEPKRVKLIIDGSSDLCSQNQDINFNFKGFTITGKTISYGLTSGPKNLSISLKSIQTNQIVQVTQTLKGGNYIFEEVFPGYYEIIADAKILKYVKSHKITVSVTNDSINLSWTDNKDLIIISGYDVKGQVLSDSDPIKGVTFALYSASNKKPISNLIDCNYNKTLGPKLTEKNLTYLCHTFSKADGFFNFKNVPPNKYKIFVFYKSTNIEFKVKPAFLEFTVEHSPIVFSTIFKVEGFNVNGRILTQTNGKGIAGAQILLTDDQGENIVKTSNTSENGVFYLENMKAKTYTIQVLAPHIFFEMQSVKLSPSNPHIPDIIAYAFEVCGKFKFYSNPIELKVTVEKIVDDELISDHMLEAEPEVFFCTFLQPGFYRIKPVIPDFLTNELIFSPSFLDISIIDEPILDLVFNQFVAKIKGSIVLKENNKFPKDIYINLFKKKNQELISTFDSFTYNFQFSFKFVFPDNYIIKIFKKGGEWCWENDSYNITIVDRDIDKLKFVQKGFYVQFLSSHPILIEIINKKNIIEKIEIEEVNKIYKHCLDYFGKYQAKIYSCHIFFPDSNNDTFNFDVNSEMKLIKLYPVKHKVTASLITIFSQNTTNDVEIKAVIQSSDNSTIINEKVKLILEKFHTDKEGNTVNYYQIVLYAKPFETITIKPESNHILFKPNEYTFKLENNCVENIVLFKGREGLFIKGKISPKLDSVKITIWKKSNKQLLFEVESNEKGEYVAGALDCCDNSFVQDEIEIKAEKEGYIFKKASKFGDFILKKLSSIIVEVLNANEKDEPPLKNVLISLSGGSDNFRKNLITPENGLLSFIGLNPGQYFFRAVLKEYQFEPSSQILNIKQDETIKLKIKGTRVAFSCYGSVNSLSQESESNVIVETIGLGGTNANGINCSDFQEEVLSDVTGNFRIRDLKPHCSFLLRIKLTDVKNSHILRSIPENKLITIEKEDIRGIRFIILYKANTMEVTGSVVTSSEYWPSLKVKLFSDSGSKTFLLAIPLTSGFFSIPYTFHLDNRWYTLKLESSLPSYLYYFESPSISFQANTSYQHFQFYFDPKPVTSSISFYSDQDQIQTGFSYSLLLALTLIALIYNYNKILSFLQNLPEKFPQFFNFLNESGSSVLFDESVNIKRKIKSKKLQ